jgi:hypothetical protein
MIDYFWVDRFFIKIGYFVTNQSHSFLFTEIKKLLDLIYSDTVFQDLKHHRFGELVCEGIRRW